MANSKAALVGSGTQTQPASAKIVVNHAELKPIVVSLWFMQAIFWLSLTVVTYFSLTLWYGTFEWHVLHTLVQSMVGAALTVPMHYVYQTLWGRSLTRLLLVSLIVVIVASLAWSVVRMYTFIAMTPAGPEQWEDFGGWYFSAFFIFLCWTAIYYNFLYYRLALQERDRRVRQVERSRQEKLKRFQAEKLASESQMQMLRYQLNPHFLFNTLNAVSALVATERTKQAREMIDKLSSFLRYSLTEEENYSVDLKKELHANELYLSIEKTRFSDRLNIVYEVAENALSGKVPSLILQPLIENSIKHAINNSEAGGTISIIAKRQDGNLQIIVADDGPGVAGLAPGLYNKDQFGFSGVGIRNTHDRLKSLYGEDYEMNLYNRQDIGLKIELIFPFEESTAESNYKQVNV